MRHTKLVALGLAASAGLFLTIQQAEAQRRLMIPHGGGGMGGFHGGPAFRGGAPGFRGGMIGAAPRFNAGPRYAMGPAVGNNWRRWQGRPGYPGYWNNGYAWRHHNNNYWGYAGAGLVGGLALGALASSAYPYGYGYDSGYAGYSYPVSGAFGNYCETPVRTCQLYEPAAVGVGCSCRVPGGRAGGVVVP